MKILIVEDDRFMADALAKKAESRGIRAHIAEDGEAALIMAKDGEYDAIITDLVMPKKGGLELLSELRKRGDRTQAIVMTNLRDEVLEMQARQLGATAFFSKAASNLNQILDAVGKK